MFDPEVMQILGLNLMSGRSPNFAENLGNAGLATMQYRRQQEEDKLRKEEREYLKQQREMQMAQMKRQQQFQDALSQGFRPGIAADPLTPMDDEGNPMPSSRPTMDFSRAMQIDPFAAMQAQAQFQSFNKPRAPISVKEGETLVNPDNFQPLFQNAKPKDAFQMLPPAEARALGLPPDQSYQRNSKTGKIDAIGRQQISVTTNVPGEDSFAKAFGSNVAGQMAEALKAGQEAPAQVNVSRRVKQLLDSGAITGPGAEQLTTVASALASTGIVAGTTAEERIANTQLLASSLARQTLSAIRGSGLGTGQGFTDKDRQFLERAASGNITLNATALKELANLNERSAIAAIRKHNDIVKRMRGNPGLGSVGSMYEELPLPSNAGYTVTNY